MMWENQLHLSKILLELGNKITQFLLSQTIQKHFQKNKIKLERTRRVKYRFTIKYLQEPYYVVYMVTATT